MQNTLLEIEENLSHHFTGHINISFKKFVEYLECRIRTEQSVRTKFYKLALKKFEQHAELSSTIAPEEIGKYQDILELVYATLLPITFDENCNLWALSTPLLPKIFYGTNA